MVFQSGIGDFITQPFQLLQDPAALRTGRVEVHGNLPAAVVDAYRNNTGDGVQLSFDAVFVVFAADGVHGAIKTCF